MFGRFWPGPGTGSVDVLFGIDLSKASPAMPLEQKTLTTSALTDPSDPTPGPRQIPENAAHALENPGPGYTKLPGIPESRTSPGPGYGQTAPEYTPGNVFFPCYVRFFR